MTNHNQMMDMMHGGSSGMMGGMSGMTGGLSGMGQHGMSHGIMANNTQSTMMMIGHEDAMQSQTGSALVQAGWKAGVTVKVNLDGNTSAFDAQDIHVMVFPHLT
ncbi:hypothetical protein [Nitrososphaera viennensis]|nr:hypothetical protein [Nitrososphaera viennensis]UVS69545.1 hypothetical protein NWT39_01875 [Nitrososphaera viennensis]